MVKQKEIGAEGDKGNIENFENRDKMENDEILERIKRVTAADVARTLQKQWLNGDDFLNLISPAAKPYLEAMAQRAHKNSIAQFGYAVQLYTPLYLANHCENLCVYCGFHMGAKIKREQLTMAQVEAELDAIYQTGVRDVLLLTGESSTHTPVSYIAEAAKIAKRQFKSVGIEVYPMSQADYGLLVASGVNGLTIYQETYDEALYAKVHLKGPKRDFGYRLGAPERAAKAGMHQIAIGALYGLGNPLVEAYRCQEHMGYLEKKFPHVEWGLSLPRLREATTWAPEGHQALSDAEFVQMFLAFRLCFPRLSMNLSTRETAQFREQVLPMGVNKFSAGVLTTVGGYVARANTTEAVIGGSRSDCLITADCSMTAGSIISDDCSITADCEMTTNLATPQFPISDEGSVPAVCHMVAKAGYQAIFSDWVNL